jgi:hypothetical protein
VGTAVIWFLIFYGISVRPAKMRVLTMANSLSVSCQPETETRRDKLARDCPGEAPSQYQYKSLLPENHA